jgi:hypothetical protein
MTPRRKRPDPCRQWREVVAQLKLIVAALLAALVALLLYLRAKGG